MSSPLSTLLEANQSVLASLADKERSLSEREKSLHAELERIENERRALLADRDILQKAYAIHERLLGGFATSVVPPGAVTQAASEPKRDAGQSRARIGDQRYAMLATLRDSAPLTMEAIAEATGLSLSRVKEQMRVDQPRYVGQQIVIDPNGFYPRLRLTEAGLDLLERFESYRRSQGKPLPPITNLGDAAEEDEADTDGAEAQEDGAQTNEAAGDVSGPDAPTASITDTEDGVSDQHSPGLEEPERQVEHEKIDRPVDV